jgi:hypothetical protein
VALAVDLEAISWYLWLLLLMLLLHVTQEPKPKRKYTRHKEPAEVSASYRAAINKLVEYQGEMIPRVEKMRRIRGRGCLCWSGQQ